MAVKNKTFLIVCDKRVLLKNINFIIDFMTLLKLFINNFVVLFNILKIKVSFGFSCSPLEYFMNSGILFLFILFLNSDSLDRLILVQPLIIKVVYCTIVHSI